MRKNQIFGHFCIEIEKTSFFPPAFIIWYTSSTALNKRPQSVRSSRLPISSPPHFLFLAYNMFINSYLFLYKLICCVLLSLPITIIYNLSNQSCFSISVPTRPIHHMLDNLSSCLGFDRNCFLEDDLSFWAFTAIWVYMFVCFTHIDVLVYILSNFSLWSSWTWVFLSWIFIETTLRIWFIFK